jgi:glycosyltransferase involved in cell wall biosynthesis/2-polyprenyl-3-methyl-5-hydroxy-6-metoxy-1,4-benzoquinol methylase
MLQENWKEVYDLHCQSRGYEFTNNWFIYNIPVWQEVLKNISDLANLNFLEIGSWEGQSTCWLLDNILTHPSSKITCIDTFEGGIEHQFSDELSLIESRFDGNLKRAKCENKLIKIVGLSQSCLRELPLSHYDVIYIDGSHIASDVLEDTILCWRLLKNGGMIIFDDYQWEGYRDQPLKHPAPAINTFLSIFQDKINVIHKGYQVIIQKKLSPLENDKINKSTEINSTKNPLILNNKNFNDLPTYYKHLRSEIFNSVPDNSLNILDVGCGAGVLGKALKSKNSNRYVVGIELNQEAVYFAKQNLDEVYQVDIEKVNLTFDRGFFDCMIFADILEHLVDPWQTLRNYLKMLKCEGTLIISIPNIRNLKIIHQLIELKSWKYEDEGILDKTHLRFFTKNDFLKILDQFNIEVQSVFYLRENRFNQFYDPKTQILTLENLSLSNISQENFEEITANQIVFQGSYKETLISESNIYNQVNLGKISLTNDLLSVVVPWWDHTEFLELWENNLKYLPNCEIIFIDNGSKEEGKKALETFCQQYNIKLIRNEKNMGFAAANNQGLTIATGNYILHLNNDLSIKELDIQYLCSLTGEGIAGPGYARNELNIPYVEGWGLCAKKSVLENLGGWNEIYGPGYWDDVDLCYRSRLAGYAVTAIPQMSQWIQHITNATGRDGRIDQIALHIANRKKFIDKYFTISPKILIDGVFFQLYKTGIARVWQSLLEQWVNTDFANHILVLDRDNTSPKINGIRYRTIASYDYNNTEADKEMLQQICNEEEAGLFISTYYTTPIETPSVFMAYDMIPELLGGDLNEPMWREKHHAIKHASAYISISENTAKDLNKCFPDIPSESITVAHCGVDPLFYPASESEINAFKYKYGVTKPYFLLVGTGSGYKNGILFFQAFAKLASSYGFDIICTGIGGVLTPELRTYTSGSAVHLVQLSDEELALAYSGAVALVYPSKYEGFGMPLLEAMACGCPVITCPNASIPEVTGEAAIYVNDDDVVALANALCEVQKPNIRQALITAGLAQSKNFSWTKMAEIVSSELINTTLLPLNLREINLIIFPDWSQPEDELGLELQEVIQTLATHPNSEKITLLINTGDIDTEDAEIFLSSVVMNLLMEDLDITDTINISLVDKLGDTQWQSLLTRIYGRITLNNEDKVALAQATVSKIHSYQIDSLISQF